MASVLVKTCDITGTRLNVHAYEIIVQEIGVKDLIHDDRRKDVLRKSADLSPAALRRLLRFVERGMTKPVKSDK